MAEVYLAVQTSLKRKVAFKVLRPEFAGDATYVARFQREAESAASLVHANIVQIYEVGRVEDVRFIAQEYVQGENLRQWMRRNGNPTAAQALAIISQAAAALACAGEKRLIHRDIKPENILITKKGEVKVADFGLARQSFDAAGESLALTQIGMTLGTPLYMSPEQAEGRKLDPRSDIYSLGVTCYHLLTGTPPFEGDTALAVAVKHLKNEPVPLSRLRPDLPEKLCKIVHKMLAKKPDERYASGAELLLALVALQSEIPSWTTSAYPQGELLAETLLHPEASVPKRRRRVGKYVVWTVLALASAMLGGVLAYAQFRGPSLLTGMARGEPVPKQDSALSQWYYASQVGTEDAWKAVIAYFPENEYLSKRAMQQLARFYLRRGNLPKAQRIFDDLADESSLDLKAFGLAGKAGILTLQQKYEAAAESLAALAPIRESLRDPHMQRLALQVAEKSRTHRSTEENAQWDDWFERHFTGPPLDETPDER